jgi:hypothetical protein
MYQAKLALWKVLEEERDKALKNVRFGIASTFLSLSNIVDGMLSEQVSQGNAHHRWDMNGIFRVEPWGSTVHAIDEENKEKPFKNGILTQGITGQLANWTGIHGQLYPLWMNAPVAQIYDPSPTSGEWAEHPGARELYKLLNRASLHVPIADSDYVWKTPDGTDKMSHFEKVRMWIDGFADIAGITKGSSLSGVTELDKNLMVKETRNSQFHFFKDPEIGIAGTFQLPMAIFPNPKIKELNRDAYISKGYVWYSAKNDHVNYLGDFRYAQSSDFYQIASPRASYNAGSGEAAGSVLDFFSPRDDLSVKNQSIEKQSYRAPTNAMQVARMSKKGVTNFTFSKNSDSGNTQITVDDLDPISFPIRAACEDNWLVLLASGQEMEPISDSEKGLVYPSYEAIKNLYDATDPAKGKKVTTIKRDKNGDPDLKNGQYQFESVSLEKPIRTIVIGVVGDPDKESNDVVKGTLLKMRENIKKMARAGWTGDPESKDPEVPIIFADNVDELMSSFRSAITIINESRINQPARGALVESPALEGEDAESNIFSGTYRIISGNQWDANLARYELSRDVDGNLTMRKRWDFAEKIKEKRGQRNLLYWRSRGWTPLGEDDQNFARLTGMTTTDAGGRMDPANLGRSTFGVTPPHKALYHWLQGNNYFYSTDTLSPRSSILSDFGQSGIVFVDNPKEIDSLPGFKEWARKSSPDNVPKIYAQTNDGILHVINPISGEEDAAILPPPVLLPSRLATLKTLEVGGKLQWMDSVKSNPSFILDGSLQKRNFNMTQTQKGWGTYLLGTLGRGGNGLYMMDVTNHKSPSFSWYRENADGKLISMGKTDAEPSVKSVDVSDAEYGYTKLGFNSPKPAMGVTGTLEPLQTRNFIALPGGSASKPDLTKNGGEGAVFIMIDPENGSILRSFTGASLAHPWRLGSQEIGEAPYMGMMISEPTLFRSDISKYLTSRIFAVDNRGSVHAIIMEERDQNGNIIALPKERWKIRTIASLQEDLNAANTSGKSYSVPHGLAVAKTKTAIWLAGGTADVLTRLDKDTLPEGVIGNEKQMIFAMRTYESPKEPFARDSLKPIVSNDVNSYLAPSENYEGWYIELDPEKQGDFRGEYVSAKPLIINGTLFIATFTPTGRIDVSPTTVCGLVRDVNGNSRLYSVDVSSGKGNTWEGSENARPKFVEFEGVKITDLTALSNGGVVATYDLLSDVNNLLQVDAEQSRISLVRDADGNLAPQIKISPIEANGGRLINPGKTTILYWFMK